MKLLIFGAAGRVGRELAARAAADGHLTTAFVRNPGKMSLQAPNLTIIQGDACEKHDVWQAVQGKDAVISALSTDGGSVLTIFTPMLIAAMKAHGIKRVVTIGTAGILDSREHTGLLRYETPDSRRSSTRAAEEHRRAWEQLAGSGLEWTVVCPTYLPAGERTGIYRVERDYLPFGGTSISVGDTAEFAYDELAAKQFIGARVGLAY
ncbi:NAD(P)-dependent oxidoreductase [Paenibacillus sp. y28]|uniref:NAD(P)-dependent oxidoreductase n=1 Tax=Paenibacillus sp. y28 TaxID=3129110 RepID=UPI0030158D4F